MAPPRVVVVGHVEHVVLGRVATWPRPGEIAFLEEPLVAAGGSGAVAALDLARAGADVALVTAVGDDDAGTTCIALLEAGGVDVRAVRRPGPQTRVVAGVDAAGERTILVLGPNHLPRGAEAAAWGDVLAGADGALFTGGDVGALAEARRARVLVVMARRFEAVAAGGVPVDVLVGSATDPGETLADVEPVPAPRVEVRTEGVRGGWARAEDGRVTRYAPVASPVGAAAGDAYGAGDCFAAGLVLGLAGGLALPDALALGATRGAGALARRGP